MGIKTLSPYPCACTLVSSASFFHFIFMNFAKENVHALDPLVVWDVTFIIWYIAANNSEQLAACHTS